MKKIYGVISDKQGKPIEGVFVALKDSHFEDLYTTETGSDGSYELVAESKVYPYLIAVKDYAVHNLEFWCQDLDLSEDLRIDACIDKLEIYGLKVFKVDGAYPAVMIYFRPMSLAKHLANASDLFPDLKDIRVFMNQTESEIYAVNEVQEYVGDGKFAKALLLHASITKEDLPKKNNYVVVQVVDAEGHLGQAAMYFGFEK